MDEVCTFKNLARGRPLRYQPDTSHSSTYNLAKETNMY
ncbi:hypothetical protein Gorai_000489, partial [Gossypium raimondii]|nr:hypothetical protein [Gossypium raimondii]